jgi:hypothetical protein
VSNVIFHAQVRHDCQIWTLSQEDLSLLLLFRTNITRHFLQFVSHGPEASQEIEKGQARRVTILMWHLTRTSSINQGLHSRNCDICAGKTGNAVQTSAHYARLVSPWNLDDLLLCVNITSVHQNYRAPRRASGTALACEEQHLLTWLNVRFCTGRVALSYGMSATMTLSNVTWLLG